MSERPEIDLEPAAFRQVFTGPLASPKLLKACLLFFGACILLGVWGAWYLDTWWSGFLVAPPAIIFGVAVAGLEPGYWFRDPPRDDT